MVIGEGVDDLLSGPLGIGVFSHIKVNDLPAVMLKDEEDIEDTEGGGGDGEEVAGSDVGDVIGQEGSPSLRRRLPDIVVGGLAASAAFLLAKLFS